MSDTRIAAGFAGGGAATLTLAYEHIPSRPLSCAWTTGGTVAANEPLSIRIVKEGGAGTVLDFDKVRFTATPREDFGAWIGNPGFGIDPGERGFDDDPDGDLLDSGIKAWFGTHPGEWSAGLAESSTDGTTTTFTHPQNGVPPLDVSGSYQWSLDLDDWYGSGSGPGGGPTVTLTPVTVATTTTVTAVASEPLGRIFFRAVATQN